MMDLLFDEEEAYRRSKSMPSVTTCETMANFTDFCVDSPTSFQKTVEWFDIDSLHMDSMDAAMDAKLSTIYPDTEQRAKMPSSLSMGSCPLPGPGPAHGHLPSPQQQAMFMESSSPAKPRRQKKGKEEQTGPSVASKISSKFLNGYDALVEAFRKTKKGNKEITSKKQQKEGKYKNAKQQKDEAHTKNLRNTQFVHALKETFMRFPTESSNSWFQYGPISPGKANAGKASSAIKPESALKRSNSKKASKSRGVSTPTKLKRQNSLKRTSLLRSLSDGPVGSSSNFDRPGGFTVEGAIQDLLAGPRKLRKEALPLDMQHEYAGLIEQRDKMEMERMRRSHMQSMSFGDSMDPASPHIDSPHSMGGVMRYYSGEVNSKYHNSSQLSRPPDNWTAHSDAEISYVMQDVTGGLVNQGVSAGSLHQSAAFLSSIVPDQGIEWTNSPSSVMDGIPSDSSVPIARCVSSKW